MVYDAHKSHKASDFDYWQIGPMSILWIEWPPGGSVPPPRVAGVVMEIPASAELLEQAYKWPVEKAIDLSIEATLAAKEEGLYTVFFTIDGSRSDLDWMLNLVDRVANEGHMDAFTLVDTFGVLTPHATTYYAKKVKERVKKPIEIHFHSDFGFGVANTVNAVLAGGEVIHSTVLGIGERAGNTPMEETVMALLTMYGIDVGIDFSKLNGLAKLVQELSGSYVPSSRPLIGKGAYSIESGIPTAWYRNVWETNPTTLFPVRPDFVGHEQPNILMGKKSGLDNVYLWMKKLGIELTDEQSLAVLQEVKLMAHDMKRTLTEEEFRGLAEKEISQN